MIDIVLTDYSNYLLVTGASPDTIRHRVETIRRMSSTVDPLTATPRDLVNYLATFDNAATRSSYRAALRTFYRWAVDFAIVSLNPSVNLPRVKVPSTQPRPISDAGLAALLERLDEPERAVALLMAYCGLRGAEACRVCCTDFYRAGTHWRVAITHPKGGGVQSVPVPDWVVEQALDQFPLVRSHSATITRISRELRRVEPGATPHSLRHWYATTALRGCGNVRIVQELLRHKSLSSTQIYTQVSEREAADVADHLPHVA